jgi:hypothetical protein
VEVVIAPAPDKLVEWLGPYPAFVQELVLAIRDEAVSRAPDATEIVADGWNAVAVGLSYTHTHVKGFIYIAACSDHVNLGFTYGASFDDPKGRLQGSGNQSRHMKVRSMSDLDDPYLWEMFDQAHDRAFRPDPSLDRRTILMPYENAKRKRRPETGP